MAEWTDHELVNQCLQGDNKAFDVLVKRYELQMFRTAFGIVNDAELAKDITQAGFIKSWENLRTFNPQYKFYSWLYRIMINEALNMKRRKKKHAALSVYRSDDDTPYQELEKKEENGTLLRAIESLPPDSTIVLYLRHFEELSYKEIAGILKIEVKTVKSRLYSARMLLREKLNKLH
jgi:RNA polymerase sigma-70 factor, ECF subfamily